MVRQETIETAPTVTSIIPASTVNSDHNSTAIITQNNELEPISSELINLDISNTLQKAKNLANSKFFDVKILFLNLFNHKICLQPDQEPAISPQAAPKKVIDMIMAEANQLQKDKHQLLTSKLMNYVILNLIILFYLQTELKPPQEASVDIYKASQKAYNNEFQHKKYQILADLWKNCMDSYLTVIKFLGHPNTCKLLNGWHPLMERKNMMLSTEEWRKNNPPPPKQVPKTAPVASSNSNIQKQPQAQNKGRGKAPATKPYSQGYRIPKIQQYAMENVFQMARKMIELQKKEEARLKYDKLFLTFLILSQS
ncbi:hypothetical protein O181_071899 [Austropuccinia psidii MF-1]|uniref:Uncharacterized protein n=1 Tax=Austropuccinia psidii MF-1 TaxID=1389203 RepID=A0A9Q3F3N8_9BASI|nr:hypothetical protein [Austropuccinia psidii MF-1]